MGREKTWTGYARINMEIQISRLLKHIEKLNEVGQKKAYYEIASRRDEQQALNEKALKQTC